MVLHAMQVTTIKDFPVNNTITRDSARLILKPELLQRVGLSYTTIYNLMRKGRFPRSVTLTDDRVAWHEHEVNEWVQTLPRQRLKGDST